MKTMIYIGGSAPSRDAELTVIPTGARGGNAFRAFWAPGYAPCIDEACECRKAIEGWGETEAEAIEDYWVRWNEQYPEGGQ